MSLNSLLIEFDKVLKKYNRINYEKLQDPLSEIEIEAYMRMLDVDDENFKLLYSWKNGIRKDSGISVRDQIFHYGIQVPLQYFVNGLMVRTFQSWAPNFIPIIMDGSGQALLFNNALGADYGKIHLYSVPEFFIEEPISYFDSIESMIETTINEYEQGIVYYDDEGKWLEINYEESNKIAQKYNPGSEIWKLRQMQ